VPTDPYGRRIAIAIGKASRPFGDDLNQCCETSPREMFAAFEARLATCLRAATMEALAIGYLFLLQRLLEHLPYRTDRGYTDAAGLIANFQADVVAQIETGHIDVRMLALCGRGAAAVDYKRTLPRRNPARSLEDHHFRGRPDADSFVAPMLLDGPMNGELLPRPGRTDAGTNFAAGPRRRYGQFACP